MSVSNAPSDLSSAEARTPITRTNIILLVVLLAQLALVAFVFWPRASTSTGGGALLAGITADAVTALTITDDSDRSVSFTHSAEGWALADSDGYPADADKITQTLTKLLNINTDRLVTRTPSSHSRLQVADDTFLRKVTITTADGEQTLEQTLYLGSSTGASATHVRATGQDATYLTDEVATWEMDTLATTWINVAYYKVPKEEINSVTLQNANGTFTFVRNGEEWTLADAGADEPIASANITTLIDRIATLNLHTVLGKSESPDYGLSTPLATIIVTATATTTATATVATSDTVTSESGEPQVTTLVMGAKDEETDTYYFKSSSSEFYVRLAAFTGDEFANKQRTDFLVQPEATTDANAPANAPEAGPVEQPAQPEVTASPVVTETATDEATAEPEATIQATEEITQEATIEATEELTTTLTPEASSTITN